MVRYGVQCRRQNHFWKLSNSQTIEYPFNPFLKNIFYDHIFLNTYIRLGIFVHIRKICSQSTFFSLQV